MNAIKVRAEPIEDPGREARYYLNDIKRIDTQSGFKKTQSIDPLYYYDMLLYEVLQKDTATTMSLSLLMITVSVFILTVNV